jgi:hypothetical protein
MAVMKIWSGALSVASVVVFTVPVWCAEGTPSSGKAPPTQDSSPQQSPTSPRSTDTTEKQSSTKDLNTGSDLTGGRDSHLGPHDAQGTQTQKKSKQVAAATGR